jgi:hypothetical protein
MRHWFGLILALDLSAALFFGTGWGVWSLARTHGTLSPHTLASTHGLLVVGALVGTGLLLGILLAVRAVSPLGTGLPGLTLLGWSALVMVHSRYALRFMPLPASHFAAGFTVMLVSGVLALAGAAMIIPLFVPSRWRRRRPYDEEYDEDDIDVPAVLGLVP